MRAPHRRGYVLPSMLKYNFISDYDTIQLKLYSKENVRRALENVARHEEMDRLLIAADLNLESSGYNLYMSYFKKPARPSHIRPDPIAEMSNVASGSNSAQLYLNNEAEALEFIRYLMINGGWALRGTRQDGSCLYSAIRRNLACPVEFTNAHLRRWLVCKIGWMYPEFFFSLLRGPIAAVYGCERYTAEELAAQEEAGLVVSQKMKDSQKLPGPFSFKTYLEYILTNGSWGDELIFSLLTQTTITILDSASLLETRIRHNHSMEDVNILLIHAGLAHYAGAGKYRIDVYSYLIDIHVQYSRRLFSAPHRF